MNNNYEFLNWFLQDLSPFIWKQFLLLKIKWDDVFNILLKAAQVFVVIELFFSQTAIDFSFSLH